VLEPLSISLILHFYSKNGRNLGYQEAVNSRKAKKNVGNWGIKAAFDGGKKQGRR